MARELALERVAHVGRGWGGESSFDGSGRVRRAESDSRTPLIVSGFRHANGDPYPMFVNNSQTQSTQARLWVGGCRPQLQRVDWLAAESPAGGGDWRAEARADFVVVRPWLTPGQMELYRVSATPGTGNAG